LAVLAVCIAATWSLVSQADAIYTSESTIVLLPPSLQRAAELTADVQSNPFLTSGLPLTASAISSAANSDRLADRLKAAGVGDVDFTVTSFNDSPILVAHVESSSAEQTSIGIGIVVDGVKDITNELQTEATAPESQFITAQVTAPPPGAPIESLAAKTKIALGMAIFSFFIVVCSALLFDILAKRYVARRESEAAEQRYDDEQDGEHLEAEHPDQIAEADGVAQRLAAPVYSESLSVGALADAGARSGSEGGR
jgi:hypothetical protein